MHTNTRLPSLSEYSAATEQWDNSEDVMTHEGAGGFGLSMQIVRVSSLFLQHLCYHMNSQAVPTPISSDALDP